MGKRYLLLGGSSDLCLAFLRRHLWNSDDEIIAHYCHSRDELENIKRELPASMELRQADFGDLKSVEDFAKSLSDRNFVPTHILHVPAVPIENLRFTEISWEAVQRQLDVQCRSLWVILQAVIKKMTKAKSGKIIIGLSSCSMNVPPKFLAGYVTAKYALMGIGKALAAEYASKGMQINMISPSMMETKFISGIYGGVAEQSASNNPMGRNATTDDVARLIEYLFSDDNTFITGANIPVTGGEAY